MEDDKTQAFYTKLQKLRDSYIGRLPEKLAQIHELWGAVQNGSMEQRHALLCIVHSLAGSGATYGLNDVSQQARALEVLMDAFEEPRELTDKEISQISRQIDRLENETTQ